VSVSYETEDNTFVIPSTDELLSPRESLNALARRMREGHIMLFERSFMTRPRVPPCETRATRFARSREVAKENGQK
jgi:hypothetical protein